MENLIQLDFIDQFPEGFADCKISQICDYFANPTIINIKGEQPPVYISTLLHGNEHTSFYVLQNIAKSIATKKWKRGLIVFIGNVKATEKNVRHLENQVDYNRIWSSGESPEHMLAKKVLNFVKDQNPFVSIDIHNNTGKNPIYGCINDLSGDFLQLASLFSNTVVYFRNPSSVHSIAFSEICPSITIECGLSGSSFGIEKATELVSDCLHLSELTGQAKDYAGIHLYHTTGRILFCPESAYDFAKSGIEFKDFENEAASTLFREDIESLNFSKLQKGFVLAKTRLEKLPIKVVNENGHDLTNRFLELDKGKIKLCKDLVPSMFTTNRQVIENDCFGYFMEELVV